MPPYRSGTRFARRGVGCLRGKPPWGSYSMNAIALDPPGDLGPIGPYMGPYPINPLPPLPESRGEFNGATFFV
ncbi:hypothetical protein DSO57_1033736 [Entomophthora muscae]|uniref:Uncharacterized protein n=1 Tax=Entomophthora muscae TaxID=34485 RepID=A0ACC2UM00_9FUNG|nr:hypothetical protein DSO57_1033736 [Entomophthora muscae]